jgi:hypothetical protein
MNISHRIALAGLMAIAIMASTLIIYPSLKQAWYDFDTLYNRKQVQSWLFKPNQTIDPAEFAKTYQKLSDAAQSNPGVAQYHIELARLSILVSISAGNNLDQRNYFYQQANTHYRSVLKGQPNNTHSMANLVQFKAYLGQIDSEFERLFAQAQQRAPHEADIQMTLLNAGYQSWAKLSPAMQTQVRQLQAKAQATQANNVRILQRNYPDLKI